MINLFAEMLKEEMNATNNYSNICLISGDALNDTQVCLPCNHKYNYYPIYREVINQRKTCRLKRPKIQCPYCRTKHQYVLPYISMEGVEKICWVNGPKKYQLLPNKCVYVFKSNTSKRCNKPCMNSMCQYHTKISANSNISPEVLGSITLTTDMQLYTVSKLRALARHKKLKGYSTLKKQELILQLQQSMS
jgi:hypothetical protein